MSIVSIIVATDENRAIGKDQQLLWRLPNDMAFFKETTTGHTIIMGRNTYESLPKGALPNRRNIVLSTQQLQFPGAETYHSLEEAMQHCNSEETVFIIGGESVYKQGMQLANKIYLTQVEDIAKEADAFFPEIDGKEWEETGRELNSVDEKHAFPYTFIDYTRK